MEQSNAYTTIRALESLDKAERELKTLLKETPALISIEGKNSRDYVSNALAGCQAAIRSLLRSVYPGINNERSSSEES